METFPAQVASTARKASRSDCKQGWPPCQRKKPRRLTARQKKSRPAPSAGRTHTDTARNGNTEHNTHVRKMLDMKSGTRQCHSDTTAYLRAAVQMKDVEIVCGWCRDQL